MYCEKCGTKLEEGTQFCPKCGISVTPVSAESFQAPPKPKKKRSVVPIIIIAVVVGIIPIGIFTSIVLVSMNGAREAARDVARQADMRMISTAQEIYYGENDAYYTSVNYPSRIGSYMTKTPNDPKDNIYIWINNTSDPKKFCVYASLEKGGYYTASHRGSFKCSDAIPTLTDCCF